MHNPTIKLSINYYGTTTIGVCNYLWSSLPTSNTLIKDFDFDFDPTMMRQSCYLQWKDTKYDKHELYNNW